MATAELLADLHCPYCGLCFQHREAAVPDYGVVSCGCARYPVVYGIPILQQLEGIDKVVDLVAAGKPTEALAAALNLFRVRWAHRSRLHQLKYRWDSRSLIADADVTFETAVQRLRKPKAFADYLLHRFANPNFLSAIGPILLLDQIPDRAQPPPRVLDLGCGAGHASFLIQTLHERLAVVSADQDFVSLYLAKRFLAPRGFHVCWDVEAPSPFPDGYFDAVFCLDAFHYFKSKRAIVAELKRTSRSTALWLFPHLHNRRQTNLVAGVPLSPEGYLACFDMPDGRLFPESEILLSMAKRGVVDVSGRPTDASLNAAPTLTFLRAPADMWRAHPGFPGALCRKPSLLTVNPIYRVRQNASGTELELQWPNETIQTECLSVLQVLQARALLTPEDRQMLNNQAGPDKQRLEELVRSFVFVPLPDRYHDADLRNLPRG